MRSDLERSSVLEPDHSLFLRRKAVTYMLKTMPEGDGKSPMARCVTCLLTLIFSGVSSLSADERIPEFLAGLRARGYFDTAVDYIDQLEAGESLPSEIRELLLFERAVTLLQEGRTIRDTDARNTTLDQAQAALEQFVASSPDHPFAARANTERANIHFERARTLVWQSRSPSNASKKEEFQQQARVLIDKAREIFQKAYDQYKAAWKTFPNYIDRDKKERLAARKEAETGYLLATLYLAKCTYEEGQTWDPGSQARKEILTKASTEFEKIHVEHRSQGAGLHARMMQGKCFEEQGDLKKALGIYNELLEHNAQSDMLRRLQDEVLRFRLICLNHENEQDHQLVIQEATEWLARSGGRSRDQVGLGIRWELALAQEQLGLNHDFGDAQRQRYLRQALNTASDISRFGGEFRDVAVALVRRVKTAMGRDDKDPADFETAYETARGNVKQISELKNVIAEAKGDEERRQRSADFEHHLNETARVLKLALQMVDYRTRERDVMEARYFLAYVNYERKRSYECVILAEYVMNHAGADAGAQALNAAEVALAGCLQAYNAAPESDNSVELQLMDSVSRTIVQRWPDSEVANEARMTLGLLYARRKQPVDSARWYSSVPATSPKFGEAQLAAGQACWAAYLDAAPLPEGDTDKPTSDELQKWVVQSEQYLRTGVERAQTVVPSDAPAPSTLTAGKVSLAQILNNSGQYQETIDLITKGRHAVLKAVAVQNEADRPQKGVTSREFASLVQQLLLRAYVGIQQIDAALQAMDALERIGGAANTQIYVELGNELKKEIQRLKGSGDARQLAEVRASFESFLDEVFERRDGQSYNSMIWVATTYQGLGEGMGDDEAAADEYFDRAADAYQRILDDGMAHESVLGAVCLRLVNCMRRQGEFSGALQLVKTLLQENPKELTAQFEAALVLQDWGIRRAKPERLLEAITGQGTGDDKMVWGWGYLSNRLFRVISAGRGNPQFKERHLESRYNSALCRREIGLAHGSGPKSTKALEAAKQEIDVVVSVLGRLDEQWWNRFDRLYQDIQRDLGIDPPLPLQEPPSFEPAGITQTAGPNSPESQSRESEQPNSAALVSAGDSGPTNVLLTGGMLILAIGGAGGAWLLLAKPSRSAVVAAVTPARLDSAGGLDFVPAGSDDTPDFGALAAATTRPKRKNAAGFALHSAGPVNPDPATAKTSGRRTVRAKKKPLTPEQEAAVLAENSAAAEGQVLAKKKAPVATGRRKTKAAPKPARKKPPPRPKSE